jgi:hypothetical protein
MTSKDEVLKVLIALEQAAGEAEDRLQLYANDDPGEESRQETFTDIAAVSSARRAARDLAARISAEPSEDEVERVAKAMCAVDGHERGPTAWLNYTGYARAALSARSVPVSTPASGDRDGREEADERNHEQAEARAEYGEPVEQGTVRKAAIDRLQKWLDDTPRYEGDDPRSVHYRQNRGTLEAAIAALSATPTPVVPEKLSIGEAILDALHQDLPYPTEACAVVRATLMKHGLLTAHPSKEAEHVQG